MEEKEMKPLALEIEIGDKTQRFVTPKSLKGISFRSASTIVDQINRGDVETGDLDMLFQFLCDVFRNQFTITQFEYGFDPRRQLDAVYAVCLFVMGSIDQAIVMLKDTVDQSQMNDKKKQ